MSSLPTLIPYSDAPVCQACGYTKVACAFRAEVRGARRWHGGFAPWVEFPHLELTCKRCHHEWHCTTKNQVSP